MSETGLNKNIDLLDGAPTGVPGQGVLPELQGETGYDSAVLEPWQEVFCWAYVCNGCHGQDAYMKAKPRVKETTARVEASKLLTLPTIINRIAEIQAENKRRWAVTADDLIEYHGRVMKTDRRLFFKDGKPVPICDLSDDAAAIIDLDSQVVNGAIVFTPVIAAKKQSADSLARLMGLEKSKIEMSGANGGPIRYDVTDDLERLELLRERFKDVLNGAVQTS